MTTTPTVSRPATEIGLSPADRPSCRFCATTLQQTFVDLGTSPLCNRQVTPATFNHAESFYPLHVYVCERCMLVQLPQYVAREEIFDHEYAYFSSFADTMLKHAERYTEQMIARFGFDGRSRVIELASNDGYLLQYFAKRGIPVLGIEPTANTAAAAEERGVPTLVKFFGVQTARDVLSDVGPANLLLGNNVLAHVPDINDFVGGAKILLASGGVVTMEFPQLLKLIENRYWDTIYHEHFSYLSFTTVERVFAHHGLTIFDVEEVDVHGGSIRIFAKHADEGSKPIESHVVEMRSREERAGHYDLSYYSGFGEQVKESKRQILDFFITARRQGKRVAGYGAPGKGNTLLNYCGIRTDFLDYTADRSPVKQGTFLPGTRIPVVAPDVIRETKPDYLFILAWNLKDEVMTQLSDVRDWGCKFVVPIPDVRIYE
jgi:hypothetical protein